jgi:hypothetical protein
VDAGAVARGEGVAVTIAREGARGSPLARGPERGDSDVATVKSWHWLQPVAKADPSRREEIGQSV